MSRVGVVTDALVALFSTIDGINVLDGPDPQTLTQSDYILVGSQPTRISAPRMPGIADPVYLESLEVFCYLQAWSGSPGMKAVRDRAVDLLGQVRLMLPQLKFDGLCDVASFGPGKTNPQNADEYGVWSGFTFSVLVKSAL